MGGNSGDIARVAGGGIVGLAINQQRQQSAAGRALVAEMNNNKLPAPKAAPTINDEKVQKARLSALQSLQTRTGRASTLLTSQTSQNNTFG